MKNKVRISRFITKAGILSAFAGTVGCVSILAGCSGGQTGTSETENVETTTLESSTATSADTGKKEEKKVKLKVVNKDGKISEYDEESDAEFLRGVLDEVSEDSDFSYSGTDSEFGLVVDTVNGERADYTLDGAYWAIYVNEEYGNFGVDSQPVVDGDTYTLKYEAAK